jgi:AcrR family transcriptional regulator
MTFSLRDVKHSLTEQTIVEKAMALFREHGFAQVSVKQIAKAAMVSEKTVFNYFPNKELIVLAGFQPLLLAFIDDIQHQVDELTLDPERLALAMRYIPDPVSPIRTVMTVARAQGRLRPEISVEHATDLFLSNVLNVIRTYIAIGHPDRVRPMLDVTLEIFLNGAFNKTDD